ncbi:hypothetical protein D9M68_799190 [compost metagenome]
MASLVTLVLSTYTSSFSKLGEALTMLNPETSLKDGSSFFEQEIMNKERTKAAIKVFIDDFMMYAQIYKNNN